MSQQWQEGDVVRLKSGGPKMTVKIYNAFKGGNVCQWFVDTDLKEGVFSDGQLVKVSEEE